MTNRCQLALREIHAHLSQIIARNIEQNRITLDR
jgi:hypothetical protein